MTPPNSITPSFQKHKFVSTIYQKLAAECFSYSNMAKETGYAE